MTMQSDNTVIVANNETQLVNDKEYLALIDNISKVVKQAHQRLAAVFNTVLLDTNWEIGRYIIEFE